MSRERFPPPQLLTLVLLRARRGVERIIIHRSKGPVLIIRGLP